MDTALYVIGQILGIIAVVLGFISFLRKSPGEILVFQVITAFIFSIHYLLIGAYTAVALNFIAAVQNVFYYFRNRQGRKSAFEPVLFTILIAVISVFAWEGWYSSFIMLGLIVNSVSLAFSDAQKIRMAMFIKSPACLIYNIFVLSGGGIIYECAVLVSSIIGTLGNRSEQKQA